MRMEGETMNSLKQLFLVIIITILVMSQVLFVSIQVFRKTITNNVIEKGIKEVDIVEILKQDNDDNPLTPTKMDQIYEIAEKGNISTQSVDDFMRSNGMKELVNTYVNDLIDSTITKEEKTITPEQLQQLITNAVNLATDESGIPLSDTTKQAILTTTSQYNEEILTLFSTSQSVKSIIDEQSINMLRFLFSNELIIIFLGIVVVLTLLLIFLTHSYYQFLFYHGIALIITAGISYVFSHTITNEFLSTSFSTNTSLKEFLVVISPTISHEFVTYSKIFLIIAMIIFIIYFGIYYWQQIHSLQKSVNHEE